MRRTQATKAVCYRNLLKTPAIVSKAISPNFPILYIEFDWLYMGNRIFSHLGRFTPQEICPRIPFLDTIAPFFWALLPWNCTILSGNKNWTTNLFIIFNVKNVEVVVNISWAGNPFPPISQGFALGTGLLQKIHGMKYDHATRRIEQWRRGVYQAIINSI